MDRYLILKVSNSVLRKLFASRTNKKNDKLFYLPSLDFRIFFLLENMHHNEIFRMESIENWLKLFHAYSYFNLNLIEWQIRKLKDSILIIEKWKKKKTFTARINNGDEYCSALQPDNDNLDEKREREREMDARSRHTCWCVSRRVAIWFAGFMVHMTMTTILYDICYQTKKN